MLLLNDSFYYSKLYQEQNMQGNYKSEVEAHRVQSPGELVMAMFFNLSKFSLKYC